MNAGVETPHCQRRGMVRGNMNVGRLITEAMQEQRDRDIVQLYVDHFTPQAEAYILTLPVAERTVEAWSEFVGNLAIEEGIKFYE